MDGQKSQARRILCVEDDADTLYLLRTMLQNWGYEVVSAGTVSHAALLAKCSIFDLYLLDPRLADGTGIELCHKIRAFDPNTPIIFYSAAANESDRRNAAEAGAQAYILKPADPDELQNTVAVLIEQADVCSEQAKQAEFDAIREEFALERSSNGRLAPEERLARARNWQLKLKAYRAFVAAGGSRANFERLWPEVIKQALLN
jgi:DNA-binding response OmpR family regulator